MNRDPLYPKIVDALVKLNDGVAFEQCAAALLGKAHPNLAPVPGGNDAGMDGAFGTTDGAFPLVCTIEEDVIGNFTRNIKEYLARRTGPKLAAVATSQCLSNTKKRNLETRAQELGVTIVNIYDGAYFAVQLYRDSKWRLELLGITGNPPALSILPRLGRFADPEVLIGRAEDLEWLSQTQGDLLLVGQPGSGKTFLHQYLAKQGKCLFAVEHSCERLADAIREQEPDSIVVDDAHFNLPLVQDLARLRVEIGGHFSIHLNCWPRHEVTVQRALSIPNARVRRLQLLRRQEVFELIKHFGIEGPDWLQHLLISQAEGKPGLAVALVNACKHDDIRHIWTGEAAARQLLGDLRLVKDEKERCVLAGFALGGDAGMGFPDVAKALELTTIQLRQITTDLSSGGLIEEVAQDRLQVRPPAIRPLLVKEVFFGGASSPPISNLLKATRSLSETASVLLSARQRDADVDKHLLEELVVAADHRGTWEHFACVDSQCACAILERHLDKASDAAIGLLLHLPHRALHTLLDADEVTGGKDGASEVRRKISEWLFPFDEASHVTVDRRMLLLSVLEERVLHKHTGKGQTFAWAFNEILDVTFHSTILSPGNSREFVSRRGVASLTTIKQVAGLWPRLRALLPSVPNSSAGAVFAKLENWLMPQRLTLIVKLPDETIEFVRETGRQILSDLIQMPNCNRAWRTRAKSLSSWGKLGLQIETDQVYELAFGERDHGDLEASEKERFATLRKLASEMVGQPVKEVVTRIESLRTEAIEFSSRGWSGRLRVIYDQIACECQNVTEWLDCLLADQSPPEFVTPFVDKIANNADALVWSTFSQLLDHPVYYHLAISRILQMPVTDQLLLERALEVLPSPEVIEQFQFYHAGISLPVMRQLLNHPCPSVRAKAALGEWHREPKGNVRPELEADWQVAVRDVKPNEYELSEIFEDRATLGHAWLEAHLSDANCNLSEHDIGMLSAVKVLTDAERKSLLGRIDRGNYDDECFDLILGNDLELFRDWLQIQKDDYLRLRPLDRVAGPRWEKMALIALECDVSPSQLADHCLPRSWGGFGLLSQHYAEQLPAYEALATNADARLRPAGKYGLEVVQSSLKREQERDRREEVYGYR